MTHNELDRLKLGVGAELCGMFRENAEFTRVQVHTACLPALQHSRFCKGHNMALLSCARLKFASWASCWKLRPTSLRPRNRDVPVPPIEYTSSARNSGGYMLYRMPEKLTRSTPASRGCALVGHRNTLHAAGVGSTRAFRCCTECLLYLTRSTS